METGKIIKEYIGARKSDWAVFAASTVLCVSSVGYLIYYLYLTGTDGINRLPSWAGPMMGAALTAVFICTYVLVINTPRTLGAAARTRRSLGRIAASGGYDRAAMELYAADKGKHLVVTEHYIFGEHNGFAAPLSDVTGYRSMYNRYAGRYSSPMASEGILVELRDGKWYTASSGKTRFSDYPYFCALLDEAAQKNASGTEDAQ